MKQFTTLDVLKEKTIILNIWSVVLVRKISFHKRIKEFEEY